MSAVLWCRSPSEAFHNFSTCLCVSNAFAISSNAISTLPRVYKQWPVLQIVSVCLNIRPIQADSTYRKLEESFLSVMASSRSFFASLLRPCSHRHVLRFAVCLVSGVLDYTSRSMTLT